MAEYTIYSNRDIDWNARGIDRVLQNIVNLLNTFRYEVAYDRIIGRDPANIDRPLEKIIPAIIAETYDLIEEYEPRVKVKNVEVLQDSEGPVIKVVVDIG